MLLSPKLVLVHLTAMVTNLLENTNIRDPLLDVKPTTQQTVKLHHTHTHTHNHFMALLDFV